MPIEFLFDLLDAFCACETERVDVYALKPWAQRVAVALTFEDVLDFFYNHGMYCSPEREFVLMPH